MRTFGLMLVSAATLSAVLGLFYAQLPVRIPLTAHEALVAAAFLMAAGLVAVVGSQS